MMNKNIISLLKMSVCPPNDGMDNRIAVSTVQAKLMQYGYILNEDAFIAMSKADLSWITNFHNEVISFLKDSLGGKYNYTPLYKNFPQEVMNLTDSELFWNAIRHYWSNGTWEPNSDLSFSKDIKFEKVKFNVLKSITENEFDNIFTSLVSINQSLMPQDISIIEWFIYSGRNIVMPATIPFKENLMTVLGKLSLSNIDMTNILKNIKLTVTDILRFCVYLSGGDISLPKVPYVRKEVSYSRYKSIANINEARDKFKFKSFKRSERRFIMNLLENSNCSAEEMKVKEQRWIKLAHGLHIGEFSKSHPKTFNAINSLRNTKVTSWYGKVNAGFNKSLTNGLKILSERPGEFMRKLDSLVRQNQNSPESIWLIMSYFNIAIQKTSNKVLFEVFSHFEKRSEEKTNRYIKIPGARKSFQLPDLKAIKPNIIKTINNNIFESLTNKFSKLDPLGNCYIDEELRKIPLPTNMRALDFSLKPIIKGTRIPFNNKATKVIRPFIHWMDNNGSEDLDLSAIFINNNSNKNVVLNFTNLRVGNSIHSGDVRHRKGACAEYIDIDIKDAISRGFNYVILTVHNFNGRSMDSVNSMFGIMEREFPEANSNWLPETITSATRSESKTCDTLLSIIDLNTLEYIFIDSDGSGSRVASKEDTIKLIDEYTKLPALSVYDLLLMHVQGRGKQVSLDQNIDTYFMFDDFCNNYINTCKYMGI